MRNTIGTFIVAFLAFLFQENGQSIIRMNVPSVPGDISEIIPQYIDFNDTLHSDTLLIHLNKEGNPVRYSRRLVTGVCIKGECRLVKLELLWNITGRYLGFIIPEGEFLSKTEHVKFNADEYTRLHNILEDSNSPLANYSIEELVPVKDSTKKKVDGVSSATIAAVLDHIVEGAVYTTYTLWHISHGITKREIERITSGQLDSKLISSLLDSRILSDKIWVLNHISKDVYLEPDLVARLLKLIAGEDIYVAERALNALKPEVLNNTIQMQLCSVFENTGTIQRRLILQKLKEIDQFNPKAALQLSAALENLNGMLVKTTLEVFTIHKQQQKEIISSVVPLLKNKNRYIAYQAFKFLDEIDNNDPSVKRKLEKFRK